MPHPFYIREPEKELSSEVDKKNDNQVGTMIKQILINIVDILKILVKWR
jgi:hypothetical protein|tara:strand:+ start:555 stop:701 length:147 start_codon:yes stop_codon:yes gene_type:complete